MDALAVIGKLKEISKEIDLLLERMGLEYADIYAPLTDQDIQILMNYIDKWKNDLGTVRDSIEKPVEASFLRHYDEIIRRFYGLRELLKSRQAYLGEVKNDLEVVKSRINLVVHQIQMDARRREFKVTFVDTRRKPIAEEKISIEESESVTLSELIAKIIEKEDSIQLRLRSMNINPYSFIEGLKRGERVGIEIIALEMEGRGDPYEIPDQKWSEYTVKYLDRDLEKIFREGIKGVHVIVNPSGGGLENFIKDTAFILKNKEASIVFAYWDKEAKFHLADRVDEALDFFENWRKRIYFISLLSVISSPDANFYYPVKINFLYLGFLVKSIDSTTMCWGWSRWLNIYKEILGECGVNFTKHSYPNHPPAIVFSFGDIGGIVEKRIVDDFQRILKSIGRKRKVEQSLCLFTTRSYNGLSYLYFHLPLEHWNYSYKHREKPILCLKKYFEVYWGFRFAKPSFKRI